MKFIAILFAGLGLLLSGASPAMANTRYDIVAVDDVNGNPTFSGTLTTTSPFSLSYNFSVVDFELHYLTKNATYTSLDSTVAIEAQGLMFQAGGASPSSFELTFYPDGSYYSEYLVPGLNAYDDSGYFAVGEQTAAVPEPASAALLLVGLGAFGLRTLRRQKTLA